jgi:hypothetical protein
VDINKKSQKMILLKPSACNILSRFLITTILNLQKQFGLLNTELEILKVYAEIHLQTNDYLLFFIDGKTARINPASNEISI